ncbi:MAG: alpha-ketoacid dehydrogenase subunit beta [Acidimicrobiia bacterium]|nr:alpha-ketoacid dehydrogenase subunit beta [bacterium]MXX01181.1 alpha-ketoacid dehydrogenase subunit beta [Acidimicrobiia bacterium]
MREITFLEAVREAQAEALASDDRVFIMGQEIGSYGGVFRATQDLERRFGDHRVRDMPIAEQSMLGAGVGAAVMGMRPIVEVMFMDFVACGMDAIVNHAAKMRYMSGDQLRAPMVIRTQGGSGTHHGSQHSQTLESWFLHVPGLALVVPSTPQDVKGLFKTSVALEHPALFVEHRALYRTTGPVADPVAPIPLGQGVIRRRGDDVTVAAVGKSVHQALAAALEMEQEGVSVEVIDLRTLVPMDVDIVLESLSHTHRLVVAHEAVERGGWAGELVSRVVAEGFDELDAPPLRAGSKATPIPFARELEEAMISDERLIARRIRESLDLAERPA